jgi:hypothetical protein
MKSNLSLSLTLIAAVASITQIARAQNEPQVPIPRTASEVPGPALGPMTPAFVQAVGPMAYVWGRRPRLDITSGQRRVRHRLHSLSGSSQS